MDKLQKIIDLQNQVTSIDQSAAWRWVVGIIIFFVGITILLVGVVKLFMGDTDWWIVILIILGLGLAAIIAVPIAYRVEHQHSYDNMKATIDVLKLQMAGGA